MAAKKLIKPVAESRAEAQAPMLGRAAPVICCVVPCYNVAGDCGPVVRQAADFAHAVVAVDDGSTDQTQQELRQAAAAGNAAGKKIDLVTWERNRGKGAALLAGFEYALLHVPFTVLVTLDGDRQHRPADIPRLVEACTPGGADMVIGQRFTPGPEDASPQLRNQESEISNAIAPPAVPWRSRFGNTLTKRLLRFRYPACPADTQSGLRAFSRAMVEEIVCRVRPGRYETELQILLLALGQRRTIATVPIPTIYIQGNRTSHFRPIRDGLRIYRELLFFRAPSAPKLPRPSQPSDRSV